MSESGYPGFKDLQDENRNLIKLPIITYTLPAATREIATWVSYFARADFADKFLLVCQNYPLNPPSQINKVKNEE